nr:13537_t:CDS:10 [Entrophospora candida]
MGIFKSELPDLIIPNVDLYHHVISNPNSIPDTKPIYIDGLTNKSITFGEFKSFTKKFASGLKSIGFKPGEVLAIVSPNHIHYPIASLGTIAFGGAVTTANPNYTVDELTYQLTDSKASIIVAHPSTLPIVLKAANNVKIPTSKIFVFDENEDLDHGIRTFISLFKDDDDDSAIIHYTTEEEVKSTVAYLCYSSGTTGRQKGVETTHYNMVANIEQVYHFEKFTPDLAFLGPLYHIFALHFIIHQALYSGASAIILSKFDINSFCHAIQDHKINIIYVVPPIVLKLVKDPAVDNYDLTSLKFLFCAAAPLSEELSNMFSNKFGTPLKQGYGLTETTPIITMDRTDDITIGSSGILVANMEAKIIDESGKELGINEQGELCVRGPNVMKGYLNNKQATKECIGKDGFFRTGDVAFINENGKIFLVDRIKELIKYKGSQVAPAELESVLLTNPIISDAAVVGIYSEQDATELPVAYVVLQNLPPDHQQTKKLIQDHVAEKVAPHKKLRGGVYIIDKIPKSPSGKILRKDLRERLKSEWVLTKNPESEDLVNTSSLLVNDSLAYNISVNSSNTDICDVESGGALMNREKGQYQTKKYSIWSAEAAIKAEPTAKVALTISEKNQATLVEINNQVFCLGKTLQDSWWQENPICYVGDNSLID